MRTALPAHSLTFGEVSLLSDFISLRLTGFLRSFLTYMLVAIREQFRGPSTHTPMPPTFSLGAGARVKTKTSDILKVGGEANMKREGKIFIMQKCLLGVAVCACWRSADSRPVGLRDTPQKHSAHF
jgi:hypothetical protein